MTLSTKKLLSSIKLSNSAKKPLLTADNTKFNRQILKVLYKEGYINNFKIDKKSIKVFLKYKNDKNVLKEIFIHSKKRVFSKQALSFNDLYIITTSKGLVTTNKTTKRKIHRNILYTIS